MDEIPVSFRVETNVGGIPITICACGVLVLTSMFEQHGVFCESYKLATTMPKIVKEK